MAKRTTERPRLHLVDTPPPEPVHLELGLEEYGDLLGWRDVPAAGIGWGLGRCCECGAWLSAADCCGEDNLCVNCLRADPID